MIDVGIGEQIEPWQPVIDRISGGARVCAYERAGYGGSDAGPFPRDTSRVAEELRQLLHRVVPARQCVLIGHSLGAVHVMTLADRHPEMVAALLLLDPPPVGFVSGERFANLAKMASEQTAEFKRMSSEANRRNETGQAVFFKTLASEHESLFADSGARMTRIRALGAIPLTVVGAEVANERLGPDAQEFQRFWIDSNKQIARLSSRGKFVLARGSTHQIHRDSPDLVAREAMELIAITHQAAR